jgi:predicted nucleic acid-binding protein
VIVVDASAAVNLVIDAPGGDRVGEAMFGHQLHAPSLIEFEVMSTLRGQIQGLLLSAEEADASFFEFVQLPIDMWPLVQPERVLELRHNFSSYDAAYIALAEVLQCPLITCDAKWLNAPAVHSADIRVF